MQRGPSYFTHGARGKKPWPYAFTSHWYILRDQAVAEAIVSRLSMRLFSSYVFKTYASQFQVRTSHGVASVTLRIPSSGKMILNSRAGSERNS
jgi:hypothetical protein